MVKNVKSVAFKKASPESTSVTTPPVTAGGPPKLLPKVSF